MLNLIGVLINIGLIFIIVVRIPQESVGLASFANQSNLLGSPRSTQRFLNIITIIGIIFYFALAIQFNLLKN